MTTVGLLLLLCGAAAIAASVLRWNLWHTTDDRVTRQVGEWELRIGIALAVLGAVAVAIG